MDSEIWVQEYGWESLTSPMDYDSEQKQLLATHNDVAIIWDVQSGLALRTYPYGKRFQTLKFFKNDSILIASSHNVTLLDKQSGKQLREIDLGGPQLVNFLDFHEDNEKVFVVACDREQIRVWNLLTGETLQTFAAEGKVRRAAISPDMKYLLTGGADGVGILWDLNTGKVHQRFKGSTEISTCKWSEDGQKFITSGYGEFWHTVRCFIAAPADNDCRCIHRHVPS